MKSLAHVGTLLAVLRRATRLLLVGMLFAAGACGAGDHSGVLGTVTLGDNFVAPDLALDEDFFYCRIQPEVLTKHS